MYLARVAAINGGVAAHARTDREPPVRFGPAGDRVGRADDHARRRRHRDRWRLGKHEPRPYTVPAARFGQRMGDGKLVDMMLGALHDPFQTIHMGVTAENVAAKYGISRDAQDALALESHRRAARAIAEGRFKDQILPISIRTKKGEVAFDTDEHVRLEASADDFTKLKPVFQKENGTVTAGNASGINDAAAAVLMMSADAARAQGVKPLARLVAYAHAGVDPAYMGIGPVPATRRRSNARA